MVEAVMSNSTNNALWKKLISKESVPTLYAAVSALLWFGGFMSVSALAHAIYHYFDGWLGWIADFIVAVVKALSLDLYAPTVKLMLIFSGVVVFGMSGINNLFQLKGGVFKNFRDVIVSLSCLNVMLGIVFIKMYSVLVNYQIGDLIGRDFGEFGDHFILFVVIYCFVSVFVAVLLATFLFVNKKPFLVTYFASVSISVSGILVAAIAMYGLGGLKEVLFAFNGVNYSFLDTISFFSIPLLLLALNPKRLRQITLFGIMFVGLAVCSMVLEKAFPAIMPHFDDAKPAAAMPNAAT